MCLELDEKFIPNASYLLGQFILYIHYKYILK